MKYVKLVLAGLLVIITASQYFIYGFLDIMIYWLIYSLIYVAIGLFQRFHKSSLRSQIFTLIYIFIPLVALISYALSEGFPKMTQTFYLLFILTLALAFVWEIVSLCLVIKEKSDEKKDK